jgi:hypothetical protein
MDSPSVVPAGGFSLDSVFGVGSNPVAPTVFRNEPFGEHPEGLSYYRDGSCSFKIVFK